MQARSAVKQFLHLLPLFLGLSLASATAPGLCAMPLAGTDLSNTAIVTFLDLAGDENTVNSNTVHIIVQPLEALVLTSDRDVPCQPGIAVHLSHRLQNTGNTASLVLLTAANDNGDGFDLDGLLVVQDLNGNGLADPGEPSVPAGGLDLAPEGTADLVVTGIVPATTPLGLVARVLLSAVTSAQRYTVSNTDTVRTAAAISLAVSKAAETNNPRPGENLRFTITAENTGYGTPAGAPIHLDNIPLSLLVLRDVVPANTTLVSLDGPGTGTVLYHLAGEPGDRYYSTPPADLATVDAVAYGFAELPNGIPLLLTLTVAVRPNATGQLRNAAVLLCRDPILGHNLAVWSNEVILTLPVLPPAIGFYCDGTYAAPTQVTGVGIPLFIAAEASANNRDPSLRETVVVDVVSLLTGDSERCTGLETGPNTGVFWLSPLSTSDASVTPVQPGNDNLETLRNDRLTAVIVDDGGQTASAAISVDPYGVVFDSRLDGPVEGARVSLIDVTGGGNGGVPGGPARVFDYDGVTPAPSTIVTYADGVFVFPRVPASTYRLQVEPPPGYNFPSTIPPASLPAGRRIDPAGSYGGAFALAGPLASIGHDLPVDTEPSIGLFVEKKAGRGRVQPGDILEYSVTVRNTTGEALAEVELEDDLPPGFTYLPGRAYLDGAPLADPLETPPGHLTFALGGMASGQVSILTYRVRVGYEALRGHGLNTAWATGASASGPAVSNRAVAAVLVEAGIFTDRAVILGKVYYDRDRNRRQDEEDPGIPGVRLYLEDGSFAVTDSEGKYSFYGPKPGLHVVKVDMTTMPAGSVLIGLSTREAGVTGSCFALVRDGELVRVDFAEGSGRQDVLEQIKARRAKGEVFGAEIESGAGMLLNDRADIENGQRTGPASGLVNGSADQSPYVYETEDASLPLAPGHVNWQAPAPPDLAELARELTNELGFISPVDGEVAPYTQINVRIKGRMGMVMRLLVNGQEILDDRIGLRCLVPEKQLEAREYVGVQLRPGRNVLELIQRDDFGNLRGQVRVVVTAPGVLSRIVLTGPAADQPADGQARVRLQVELADENGVPVTVQTPLTLEASLGRWLVQDLDPREPGVQVFVAGGRAVFFLQAPSERGECSIRISSGVVASETSFYFATHLRQPIAVGFAELRWTSAGSDQLSLDGGLFFQGLFRGFLLTVSYDPDREADGTLFRDLQPDDLYPVYGDSSLRGFEAQSTSPFYLQIESGQSYLRYGDFTTGEDNGPALALAAYNRSLNGGKLHLAGKYGMIEGYFSESQQRQVVEEIRAFGTSGPYRLGQAPCVANSEIIEIVVRDRDHPAVIVRSTPQQRGIDYELDPVNGEILFRRPLPSVDEDLNPIFVRVAYETEQEGESYAIMGLTGQLHLGDGISLFGTWARNEDPAVSQSLYGLGLNWRLADQANILLELAQSENGTGPDGLAGRMEVVLAGRFCDAKLLVIQTSAEFDNSSSPWGPGRLEADLDIKLHLQGNLGLAGKAFYSEDTITGDERAGLRLTGSIPLSGFLRLELGLGYITETVLAGGTAETTSLTELQARLNWQLPEHPGTLFYGEYQANVLDFSQYVLAVGGEYQLPEGARLYVRHELMSSLDDQPSQLVQKSDQAKTLVGIESANNGNGGFYGEYRMRDAFADEAEIALGLRHQWTIAPGLRLNLSYERLTMLDSEDPNDNTALTLAGEYTGSPVWKASARLEFRAGNDGHDLLSTVGAAWKINRDWTLIARNSINLDDPSNTGSSVAEHLQLGLAFRQTDLNHWNALGKYDFYYEQDGAAEDDRRQAHGLSLCLNYQPVRAITWGFRYAGRFVTDYAGGALSNTVHLLQGSYAWDMTERWNLSLWTQVAWSTDLSPDWGCGIEIGYLVYANVWLCAGYMPLYDPDDSDWTDDEPGFQVSLRFKFDEDLFERPENL